MENIILAIICILIIFVHTFIGIKNLRKKEKNCTEIIMAKVENIIAHDWKIFKFYTLVCNFSYNNKTYIVRKGLFQKIESELKEIKIHIDPNNPTDCYLKNICERCRRV